MASQLMSPWAERFGICEPVGQDAAFKRGPTVHSGIAPEHPWLHPEFYAEKPYILGTGRFRDRNEIDRFLLSDTLRSQLFPGMQPWQFGVVNNALRLTEEGILPGGHDRASASLLDGGPNIDPDWFTDRLLENDLIKPDESSWFAFFRKDRWYDWRDGGPLLGGGPWSIDHPLVWKQLSIPLELANRALRALVQDQHTFLQTLLFGYLDTWEEVAKCFSVGIPKPREDAMVLISTDFYQQLKARSDQKLSAHMDKVALIGSNGYTSFLEKELANLVWGFDPSHEAFGSTYMNFGVITLSVLPLKLLLEGNCTLAERFLVQLNMAATVSHALTWVRYRSFFAGKQQRAPVVEPFIDFCGSSEMGFHCEAKVWGGAMNIRQDNWEFPPHTINTLTWPHPNVRPSLSSDVDFNIPGHWDFAPGKIVELAIVPVEFAFKLLSEEFWNDRSIHRKSDKFFHRTPLFISKTPNVPSSGLTEFVNPIGINQELGQDQLTLSEKVMVQQWKEKEAQWVSLRSSWYYSVWKLWNSTPWGKFWLRFHLPSFKKAFPKRELEKCADIASALVQRIPWTIGTSRNEYVRHLNSASPGETHDWIHQALRCDIGLLMMAAIPIRVDTTEDRFTLEAIDLFPSKEARAKGRQYIKVQFRDLGDAGIAKSLFHDPTYRELEDITDYNHVDYLDQLRIAIAHTIKANKPLSAPWLREILQAENLLRTERTQQMAGAGTALSQKQVRESWASSWSFTVPEYNPRTYSILINGNWERVNMVES
ncbi:hypothetical protein F4802DRAFT_566532 [Xylaria palmicola]|nr:hypothetical protein F4802DRAFT_566532 [Xylaria palmicola]